MKLYVYALVPPDAPRALGSGIEDEPLRLVALGPLAAVVGELDGRPSIAPATLEAHDEVVRAIGRASDAVLPLRFGAMVTDEDELREGLRPRLAALAEALERTRGCDQMTVRLYADDPEPSEPPERPTSGAQWLRDRSGHPLLAGVRDALGPLVRGERVEPGAKPPLRASVFHLVERSRIDEYKARARQLSERMAPAHLVTTGPWPPYAFTELE